MKTKLLCFALILSVVLIGCSSFTTDKGTEEEELNELYQKILKVIQVDATSVKVESNNQDITEEFLGSHLSDIEKGNFKEALKELQLNKYGIRIQVTSKNRKLLLNKE